ncbi:MAG: DUF5110 domain-containing protein [Phycisphaerales bacterium]|nr:DUF5110 domain-containing protein [Phycisphaerales bacterium]
MFFRIAACTIVIACISSRDVAAQVNVSRHPGAEFARVAMKTFGNARFTCLADGIIRMEYDANRRFEDRPTLAFIHRDRRSAFLDVSTEASLAGPASILRLTTPRLTLTYVNNGEPFNATNLTVQFMMNGEKVTWRPCADAGGNLLGTYRTLDGISGATDLPEGLLSRDGWAIVDESDSVVLEPRRDRLWPAPRNNGDAIDWYIFAYGHDYKAALADFTAVTGRVPLPPRYAFGTWWSRYWAYSADELRTLVNEFDANKVPLDVLVIDMDWHLDGWTGYTWNRKYFPDPDGFLKEMHHRGLKTTLNLHPADGVGKHEAQFAEMCKAMGLDPEKTDRIPFDSTDPTFVDAYFNVLHHPLEKQGIDFWWMDWQQGAETKVAGLDPLPWLNYLHWTDMARRAKETGRRPLIFSRWGGLGNHRYQIGFSGDTFCNWQSLAFQPFFTATAGNVGFGYWSHDIGGHQPGRVDPELYARWIQFGAMSPILRTHTTKNPEAERRIWKFPAEAYDAAKKAFQLRYHLIPYIYTAARECFDTGLPICRPLYYEWPELSEAYARDAGYLFGDALLVAPVVRPADPASGMTPVTVWLPPGRWRNGFTGRVYNGPTQARLLVPLDEMPIFVREGRAIPAMPVRTRLGEAPIETLVVHVFHQAKDRTSTASVYEDDNISDAYRDGAFSRQTITTKGDDDDLDIDISGATGGYSGMPLSRRYEIRVEDSWPPKEVKVDDEELPFERDAGKPGWSYEPESLTLVIRTPSVPIKDKVEIELEFDDAAEDRSVLDDGLRGQLRILRDVETLLGSATPERIRQFNQRVASLSSDSDSTISTLRALPGYWPTFVADVADSGASESAKQRALIRLLGLVADLHVTQNANRGTALDARLDITTTAPTSSINGIAGTAKIQVDSPWQVDGDATFSFDNQARGGEVSKTWNVEMSSAEAGPDHVWQTSAIRLDMQINLPATTSGAAGKVQAVSLTIDEVVLPSINAWWIVGPFDAGPQSKSLSKPFPPENQPVDLTATFEGKDGKQIGWRKRAREIQSGDNLTEEFFTDFDDFCGHRVYDTLAYAVTWIEVPADTDAVLAIGTDDGVVVWLNGEEVHRKDVGRAYTSKQDRVNIHLKRGVNELRIKVNQGGGDWAFAAHVETPNGEPLPGMQVRLNPGP